MRLRHRLAPSPPRPSSKAETGSPPLALAPPPVRLPIRVAITLDASGHVELYATEPNIEAVVADYTVSPGDADYRVARIRTGSAGAPDAGDMLVEAGLFLREVHHDADFVWQLWHYASQATRPRLPDPASSGTDEPAPARRSLTT